VQLVVGSRAENGPRIGRDALFQPEPACRCFFDTALIQRDPISAVKQRFPTPVGARFSVEDPYLRELARVEDVSGAPIDVKKTSGCLLSGSPLRLNVEPRGCQSGSPAALIKQHSGRQVVPGFVELPKAPSERGAIPSSGCDIPTNQDTRPLLFSLLCEERAISGIAASGRGG
jgi:hypothetical protein